MSHAIVEADRAARASEYTHGAWRSAARRFFGILLLAALTVALVGMATSARANDAEVVSLTGKGDSRETVDSPWKPTAVKQKLPAGSFVRTGDLSQMSLLLRDRTQIRLHQLSILQIKAIRTAGQATKLDLPQGRVWSQAKQPPLTVASRKQPTVEVSMPGGTAAIHGTDWELAVGQDGMSTVTVLSGEIEFYNEAGRVSVYPNEQARAAPGKAPTKSLLSNAAERVQWVTSYRPQPRKWVKDPSASLEAIVKNIEAGDYAAAMGALTRDKELSRKDVRASLLLADLYLSLGKIGDAISSLAPHAANGSGNPMAAALLARAYLLAGRFKDAEQVLASALAVQARHAELLLSRAEHARLEGNADAARRAYLQVIETDPNNAEAWYGIGRIETEREYAAAAGDALKRAIALRPDGPGFRGELGTLQTFSNEFSAADEAFREALAQQPDDYVALTGLGVLQLKRGDAQAALDSFLKAGVIEPRYARARLFSGVAYYQLGNRQRAIEEFQKAAQLDAKDPLPHLMLSLVFYDALELGRAIETAREAQARMPYLKSLNQLLNNQKGSANLGSALAAFGLEEWSQAYAYDSYSPYWAGSHLFLSDRFQGTFNKNSELFKGYLSDPSVFGASNRFSSLIPSPGHYGSIEAVAARDYMERAGVSAALNGYNVSSVPFSYYLGLDATSGDSRINSITADGRMKADGQNLILGIGLRPSHELGFFAFANAAHISGRLADNASGLTDDPFTIDYRRFDAGLNYKFNPTNHAWLKIGTGSDKVPMSGAFFSPAIAGALNTAFAAPLFTPAGRLLAFRSDTSQHDIQWRHTFDLSPRTQLSWGIEFAEEDKPFSMNVEFLPLRIRLAQGSPVDTRVAYASGKFELSNTLDTQVDLHYQDSKLDFMTDQAFEVAGGPTVLSSSQAAEIRHREINPRIGVKWRPVPDQTVRVAVQRWRRPAGVNTLGPVDTVGIPLDDRIEQVGGLFERARVQHELQFGHTFVQWFADFKRVENPDGAGTGAISGLELGQLDRLRARESVYGQRQDYFEDTPKFGAGRVQSFGLAANRLVTRDFTLATRYIYADATNTSRAFSGKAIPFHPKHYLNLAGNWRLGPRWIAGPSATYRTSRYADETNSLRIDSGWTLGFQMYWESEDKKVSVTGSIDNICTGDQTSLYRNPVALLRASYRF